MKQQDNQKLILKLSQAISSEKTQLIEILDLLVVVEENKLFADLGYSSMFALLTERFRYSEGAAMRRLTTSRFLKKYPQTRKLLHDSELNLSTICLLSREITADNKEELIELARNKNKRELERALADYRQVKGLIPTAKADKLKAERIKVVPPQGKEDKKQPTTTTCLPLFDNSTRQSAKNENSPDLRSNSETSEKDTGRQEVSNTHSVYKLEFVAKPELESKLAQARVLLSNKYPCGANLGQILEEALDALLTVKSAKSPKQVSTNNSNKDFTTTTNIDAPETPHQLEAPATPQATSAPIRQNRYIPVATRRLVMAQDNYCCSYVAKDGKRCQSRWDLEIDHIKPFAYGGSNDASNLRLLCRTHNHYLSELSFSRNTGKFTSKQVNSPPQRR